MRTKRKPFGKTRVLERDNYTCQYCGKSTTEVDHIIPVSFKEDNSMENMVACCRECNSIAYNFLFDSFIDKKNYILDRKLKKLQSIPDPLQFPELENNRKPEKEEDEFLDIDDKVKRIEEKNKKKEEYKTIKLCKVCKKFFYQKREWQKFCSKKCRMEYWIDMQSPITVMKRLKELEKQLEQLKKEKQQIEQLKRGKNEYK